MEELYKKLEELSKAIKAIKAIKKLNPPVGPKLPDVPSIKAPPQPTMQPASTKAPKIGTGEGPNSKKDPKKVAQQIKDGAVSTKTVKDVLKSDKNGQWSMADESTDPSSV